MLSDMPNETKFWLLLDYSLLWLRVKQKKCLDFSMFSVLKSLVLSICITVKTNMKHITFVNFLYYIMMDKVKTI